MLLTGSLAVTAQTVNINVNAGIILKNLSGIENGMNMNYLTDDHFYTPQVNTTAALNRMGSKLLRYPGGEKSDNYYFSAAPWTAASPRSVFKDPACYWPTSDSRFIDLSSPEKLCKPEVLDFDEFMTMCGNVGAQALIVVPYDAMYNTSACGGIPTKAELITHAAEWVRYANITKGFGIKYWMIGNESWGDPKYNGEATAAQYATDINDFAVAMKAIDPTIKIVVNAQRDPDRNGADWWRT